MTWTHEDVDTRPCEVCDGPSRPDEVRCDPCHDILEDADFDPITLARLLVSEREQCALYADELLRRKAGAA